jgi:hypothetical protein
MPTTALFFATLARIGDKGGDAFLLDYIHSTIQLTPAGYVGVVLLFYNMKTSWGHRKECNL